MWDIIENGTQVSEGEDEAWAELERRRPAHKRSEFSTDQDECLCTPFGITRSCPLHGDDA